MNAGVLASHLVECSDELNVIPFEDFQGDAKRGIELNTWSVMNYFSVVVHFNRVRGMNNLLLLFWNEETWLQYNMK